MKYVRLMRLQDQYLAVGAAIASGIALHMYTQWIFLWAIAVGCISIVAFVINELVDRQDTDPKSWNGVHISKGETFNKRILQILLTSISLLGLALSYAVGLFWWGVAFYVLGILYSVKPFRWKGVFGLDLLDQTVGWIIIPFVAPYWITGMPIPWLLVASVSIAITVGFFMYQIADYPADVAARLRNTHVVLGLHNSFIVGAVINLIGLLIFLFGGVAGAHPWAWPFVSVFAVNGIILLRALIAVSPKHQVDQMRMYARFMKPATRLFIPYLLIWWVL